MSYRGNSRWENECFVFITEVAIEGNGERSREPHRQLTMSELKLKETRGLDKSTLGLLC